MSTTTTAGPPPHVTPLPATMSGALHQQYQPTDESFNFYSQQYSNEMLRLPSNPDLQKLNLLYGGHHPAQLTKQLSLDINSFLNLNGQQSHYPYTSASNTPTHQDSTGTDTLASLPLHHQATSGVIGGSLSRNNSLQWAQMPAAVYPNTKRQLSDYNTSATNSPSSAQTKRQRISTDDLALPVSQYQPHSGASSTVVMPSSDEDQPTDSPHSTSSVPPLSPMLNSPPYSTHTHAASPFRHSAADVLTSEFTLPPPMQTSSSGGDNHSPRVGKLSRYITVDEPQQSQQASNGSTNGQSYAILNALSPDSRTKALPSTASQLRAVLGGNNAVRVEHNQQQARNNGVVKHRAAAQAYPAAFQSPTLQAVIPKDTRGLHNSPVAQAVRSPPMLSAAVPKSTLSALQQPRPQLQPHPSHYTPTPQPLPEHYASIHRRADHLQPPRATSPRSSTPLSDAGSVTSHSTTSSAHSHKLKTQNANTMVLNADGQLVKRRHRDNLSSPTIATPQSSSVTPPLSSTRSSSRPRRPSAAQTSHKGHLETTMSHKNYRDTDGKDHDIRILTVTNTAIDGVETFVHAADLGGVVERKSNISRLFGQFNSPAEKVLMNVTGSHNHSIGQESNVLTRAGVLKFFTVSKMRGQDAYKRWIEQSLLPIFARDSSVMENVDPLALQAPSSLPLAPQRTQAPRKTPTKTPPKRKATKSRYAESDDDSESDVESVLEDDDDEQDVIQGETDSDNDEEFKPSSR